MICHHYKTVFIHIPKTAGQSIEHVFLNQLGLNWRTRAPLLLRNNDLPELGPPRLAHLKANDYVRFKYMTKEMFDGYYKFCFVRNPWSRMVSLYKYLEFDRRCSFSTFLIDKFRNGIFKEKSWFVGPQIDFLCNDNGEIIVDYVGKFEELQNNFNHVCKEIGFPFTELPHVNESKDKKPIFSYSPKGFMRFIVSEFNEYRDRKLNNYKSFKDYYDDDSIDCVAELYRTDIEQFNYKFE